MCCHTLLDHIIYMDVQMRNKCCVSTSQAYSSCKHAVLTVNSICLTFRRHSSFEEKTNLVSGLTAGKTDYMHSTRQQTAVLRSHIIKISSLVSNHIDISHMAYGHLCTIALLLHCITCIMLFGQIYEAHL